MAAHEWAKLLLQYTARDVYCRVVGTSGFEVGGTSFGWDVVT